MAPTLIIEERFEMPLDIVSLGGFRRWVLSEAFPEEGRIDFVRGSIEVDMSPEDLFTHGTVKIELIIVLGQHVRTRGLGWLFTDRTRVSAPVANLSTEPDIVFVSEEAIDSGRVRLVSRAAAADRFAEIEGAVDLVVEIVSDSSSSKDTQRLPAAYYEAGVRELWLVDARQDELLFRIHKRGAGAFEPAMADPEGFQPSVVLGCSFRLERNRDRRGHWKYSLLLKD